MKQRIEISPLSVNKCWQGRRFKTPDYKEYESVVLMLLKKQTLPEPPYRVNLTFGFKTTASDIDNPIKPILDILQKKYGFNDNKIYELNLKKFKTKEPFIDISIEQLSY